MRLPEFFSDNHFSLQGLYTNRLNAAWDSLRQDIDRWQKIIPPTAMLYFHVNQFAEFSQSAYDLLQPKPPTAINIAGRRTTALPLAGPLDAEDFRAVVIGVLTAHWAVLRQIVTQRVSGSPYLADLEKLDTVATEYYHRLRAALPPALQTNIKSFAPMIHLGSIGSTIIFNQNVPLVVSIPYNAIDTTVDADNDITTAAAKSRLAIPHEIGHAILLQAPAILSEIKNKVAKLLAPNGDATPLRRQILADIIVGWLEEILADMLGTALAREEFVVGAMWLTASSEANIGISDKEHPPTLVRPFIHVEVLNYLNHQRPTSKSAADISEINERYKEWPTDLGHLYVSQMAGEHYLNRQFKSVPALAFITLNDVKTELIRVVKYLLKTKLKALGMTLGELLSKCDTKLVTLPVVAPEPWGQILTTDQNEFALTLPANFDPDFQTPMTLSKGICWIPIIGEIICA